MPWRWAASCRRRPSCCPRHSGSVTPPCGLCTSAGKFADIFMIVDYSCRLQSFETKNPPPVEQVTLHWSLWMLLAFSSNIWLCWMCLIWLKDSSLLCCRNNHEVKQICSIITRALSRNGKFKKIKICWRHTNFGFALEQILTFETKSDLSFSFRQRKLFPSAPVFLGAVNHLGNT